MAKGRIIPLRLVTNLNTVHKKGDIRWIDSPGLDHGCGVCGRNLNDPRAKKKCYGPHMEPCMQFHQTMFQIGCGHKCDACLRSKELHHLRHKDISSLIHEIKEGDEEAGLARRTARKGNSQENSEASPTKKRKTAVQKRRQSVVLSQAGPSEAIDEAIHGSLKVLPTMRPEEADDVLNGVVELHEYLLKRLNTQNPPSSKHGPRKIQLQFIQEILQKLNVPWDRESGCKHRQELVEQLADHIFKDIEQVANEARETLKRKAAYFDYVNKNAYEAMVRNNEARNWATGEKFVRDVTPP